MLIIRSHRVIAGSPSRRNPASSAMISASVELCETAPCFLHNHVIGQNVCVPKIHNKDPYVDLLSLKSPAKLASQNNISLHSLGLFPIQLLITECLL